MNPKAIFPIALAVVVSVWWIAMKVLVKNRKGEPITGSIAIVPAILLSTAVALALAL